MSDFAASMSGGFVTPRRPNGGGALFSPPSGWASVSQLSGVAQVLLGLVIFMASSLYLMNSVRLCGQLIGALSMVLGVVGVLGLRTKRPSMQMLFVVGMGFMAMMTLEFTVQVGRDVDTHCSFAEAYTRLSHLEETMVNMRHDEMVTQLFTRLNEVDDMLDMVQEGNLEKLELASKSQDLMDQDAQYIGSKIQMLRHHADHVLEHLAAEGDKADSKIQETNDPVVKKKQKALQAVLQQHLENVSKVLDTLDEKERKGDGFTYEEYEELFHALLGGHKQSKTLHQEKSHLPFLKAAWDRYEQGYPAGTSEKQKVLDVHRGEQRAVFEERFHQTMDAHQKTGPSALHRNLAESLEDLPEHCMMENDHLMYFLWGGWLLILAQVGTAYVTATSLVVANTKKDF